MCFLRRFLRARKFDVEKAKAMIIASEQWRKDYKVDDIVRCAPAARRARCLGGADHALAQPL